MVVTYCKVKIYNGSVAQFGRARRSQCEYSPFANPFIPTKSTIPRRQIRFLGFKGFYDFLTSVNIM